MLITTYFVIIHVNSSCVGLCPREPVTRFSDQIRSTICRKHEGPNNLSERRILVDYCALKSTLCGCQLRINVNVECRLRPTRPGGLEPPEFFLIAVVVNLILNCLNNRINVLGRSLPPLRRVITKRLRRRMQHDEQQKSQNRSQSSTAPFLVRNILQDYDVCRIPCRNAKFPALVLFTGKRCQERVKKCVSRGGEWKWQSYKASESLRVRLSAEDVAYDRLSHY